MKPTGVDQKTFEGKHALASEEGNLPSNQYVWRCKICNARAVDSDEFENVECEPKEEKAHA